MTLPGVAGVGVGVDPRTGDEVVMVFMTRQPPTADLGPAVSVPRDIDGVPVRVAEAGQISAQGGSVRRASPGQ
jgi:hypothetical protein